MSVRLLDADILIDLLRKHANAIAWIAGLSDLPLFSGLAVMEVVQGCRNASEIRAVDKLIAAMPIVWPTESDCNRALADFKAYFSSHSLGLLDSLNASTTIGRSAVLCTFNVKHYRVVPGLTTEQPYSR